MELSASTWHQPVPATRSAARTALVGELAAEVVSRGPGRLAVAVDGRTGAGKTSFGHELGQAIESSAGRSVYRASLDDFKRPWSERHRYDRESGEGYYRNAFDLRRLRRCLLDPIRGDGVVALCAIDPLTQVDHGDETVRMAGDGVLVVDGVFALRPELADAWDLVVWLEVSADDALARGLARDGDDEATRRVHRDRYGIAESTYLSEVDAPGRADVVVDNADLDAPRRLTARLGGLVGRGATATALGHDGPMPSGEPRFGIDDLDELSALVADTWTDAADLDWSVPAGDLDWSCLHTADHAVDCVYAPAFFLASRRVDGYPELGDLMLGAAATPMRIVESLGIASRLLRGVVQDASPDVQATLFRRPAIVLGDPGDFLPRAALELALHAHDVCRGLGVAFAPSARLCLHLREHTRPWPLWTVAWNGLPDTDDPWADLLRGAGRRASDG